MKNPKVSILMPAYNSEQYVAEAIESILNQTFTDFEFIIINDGSTDNTARIVRKYAKQDERIRFIDSHRNRGFIARLNQCLDLARGEYIAKMDSDDISLPERLEKQVRFLDEHIECGLVGCGFRAFDKGNFSIIHPYKVGMIDMLRTCATTIIMARKSVVDKFNLRFDPNYPCAEDYDFYSRFLRCADIYNLQEILYLYRWHGENVSIKKNAIQVASSQKVRDNILNLLTQDKQIQDTVNNMISGRQEKTLYLFSRIPVLRIKKTPKYVKYYLFGRVSVLKTMK